MPNILLLSAYHADSHRYWCNGLMAAFPEYSWTLLSLPPRHFSWRIRGNSLTWAFAEAQTLNQPYDLVIATSMVDLAGLRGLVPAIATVPTLVYFHENQFAYPRSLAQHSSVEPQMVNLYTALCGDQVVFNSDYNRQTFIAGVDELMKKLPDAVPTGLAEHLLARSSVQAVPLHNSSFRPSRAAQQGPLTLIWNHRWEYDKAPERLLGALRAVSPSVPLRVHVVGQRFRREPEVMQELHDFLGERGSLGAWGYVEDVVEYKRLLQTSHGVLSTAIHDFQGLAVLEGVAAGCLPLVPRRLAYPEWFGAEHCYAASNDAAAESAALAQAIEQLAAQHASAALPVPPDMQHFCWAECRNHYLQLFAQVSRAF